MVHFKVLGWLFVCFAVLGLLGSLYFLVVMPTFFNMAEHQLKTQPNPYGMPSAPGSTPVPGMPPGATNNPFGSNPQSPEQAMGAAKGMMSVVGIIMLISSLFGLLTGVALLAKWQAGRVLAIIESILSLPGFPLGTALGIYGLWAMLRADGASDWDEYVNGPKAPFGGPMGPAGYQPQYPPPPQPQQQYPQYPQPPEPPKGGPLTGGQ